MRENYLTITNLNSGEEGTGLSGLSLRLSRGDFVEMLGSELSGKRTLSSLIRGQEQIISGQVKIGKKIYGPGETIMEDSIQCLGRIPSVVDSLTVAENVMLLTKRRKLRFLVHSKDMESRVSYLLASMNLSLHASDKVRDLSVGEKRTVELLRAAENDIRFLFIENIFDQLGQTELQMIDGVLRILKEKGLTILIVGSGFPRFLSMDDRVIVIRHGRTVRTFYKGSFDREHYVKWFFGVSNPDTVRASAIRHLGGQIDAPLSDDHHAHNEKKDNYNEIFRAEDIRIYEKEHISFSICRGEIVGLYDMENRNSTAFIRYLVGEKQEVEGKTYLCGEIYKPRRLQDAVKKGIAYIPDNILECAVLEKMSYGENLALPVLRQISFFRIIKNDRILRYLEREYNTEAESEIANKGSISGVAGLSAFDRMRIAMQRTLVQRPVLLLMEDVINDMSVQMLQIQTEYLSGLIKQGCAVLVTSQNITVLRQVCDRVIILSSEK